VAAGVGIGMVPRSSVVAVDALKTVEISDPWAPRDLQLCARSRALLAPAAAALFDHLAAKGRAPALTADA
ncbi:LysR family transcriptional regulator, partial [Citrobacter sp. AAK_AS5]